MRTGRSGKKMSLSDAISDIITDGFPESGEIGSFIHSRDFDRMLEKIVDEVKEHIGAGMEEALK